MRRFLVVAALVALFAAPVTAVADEPDPLTVSVGSIHMVAKVVVNVEVTFACQPMPVVEYPLSTRRDMPSVWVELRQAVARQQAVGTQYLEFADADCDGAPHTVVIAVKAEASGPPFKPGGAALNLSGNASYMIQNDETWNQSWVTVTDSTGWIKVKLGN